MMPYLEITPQLLMRIRRLFIHFFQFYLSFRRNLGDLDSYAMSEAHTKKDCLTQSFLFINYHNAFFRNLVFSFLICFFVGKDGILPCHSKGYQRSG